MPSRSITSILSQTLGRTPLSEADALTLLEQTDSQAIEDIRSAADQLRRTLVGDAVTYVVNRNINFTNICEQHCSFCAFRRDATDADAYWYSNALMVQKAKDAVQLGATELCIQGGLHPEAKLNGRSLDYYTQMIGDLKAECPTLHIHAFSPQEVQFIAREDQLSFETVLQELKSAGVNSLPGTAAEILDDQIRRVLCPEKINADTWETIIQLAHKIGLTTTSTMLCGHIESPEHQISHLSKLRSLQKQSLEHYETGISEFILLPYVGETAPAPLRRRVGRDQPEISEVLKLTAVSRLFLGAWIRNHQPSWVKLGIGGAQTALSWGCNDIGGTLMEEHITTSAGAKGGTGLTVAELEHAIAQIERPSQQRTTLYSAVQTT